MKKQQEFSGASALQFVDNVEELSARMESNCAEIWRNVYVRMTDESEFFNSALAYSKERQNEERQIHKGRAIERIKSFLCPYLALPNWNGQAEIRQDDVEHLAYRIRLQKAAQRICDRYGIEIN